MNTRVQEPVANLTVGDGRRRVASYATYEEATEAVNYLADNRFPVERVSLVGRGVTLVEQVTGRAGYLDSALRGAFAGAVAGVLVGWLFGVFDWFNPVVASGWLALDGLWFGAVVGTLMGLLQRALFQGRREFTSVGRLGADRYELVVDEEVAEEAKHLLDQFAPTKLTVMKGANE